MRLSSSALGLFGSLAVVMLVALLACTGCSANRAPAAAPEGNPWADYKGTYAAGDAAPTSASAADSKSDAKPKSVSSADTKADSKPKPAAGSDAKSMYGMAGDAKTDDLAPDAAPAAPAKKVTKKRPGAGGKKNVAKKTAKRAT